MIKIQQTYKNRAQALRFLQDLGFTSSERTFYGDCSKRDMIEPDGKSIQLSSLIAYLWSKFPPIPIDRGEVIAEQRAEELAALELEEKQLKVAKLRNEKRKEDKDWFHKSTVYEREGGLVGQLVGEVRYQLGKNAIALITLCHGDPKFEIETSKQLENSIFAAVRNMYENGEIEITYEEDADE